MKIASILALLSFMPVFGFAAAIYVPDNDAKIQDAIDAAVAGDTIIDGSGWGSIAVFKNGEGPTSPLGTIPNDGVLGAPATVPSGRVPGDRLYFQALVSKSVTMAANLMLVEVE